MVLNFDAGQIQSERRESKSKVKWGISVPFWIKMKGDLDKPVVAVTKSRPELEIIDKVTRQLQSGRCDLK